MKAEKLRPGDRLLLPDGRDFLELDRVQLGVRYVRLTPVQSSGGYLRSFSVPNSCRFARMVVSRRINTRPDLVGAE